MQDWENKTIGPLEKVFNGVIYREMWGSIIGFEGLYEVSNFGRVRSLNRVVLEKGGVRKPINGKIRSVQQSMNRYLWVILYKDNKGYIRLIHRMVGETFLDNKNNYPEINHKNGIPYDNFYKNLEWVTKSQNAKHSYAVLNRKPSPNMTGKFGKLHPNSKPVYCATLGIKFESARIAERELGISQGSISDICNGKQLHRDGLVFNFV